MNSIRMRFVFALCLASSLMAPALADDWNLLDKSKKENQEILRDHFRRVAHAALDRRLAHYETLKTTEQIQAWQLDMRGQFKDIIGGFWERTPLNAKVVGKLDGDGFRVEKITYESQPNFQVTATLYLPNTKPPYPAVLFPCGHTEDGKAAATYQTVCILLAQNGIAALNYDPPGQGERKQILKTDDLGHDTAHGEFASTSEHMVTGIAPILLGRCLATYFIWDGIRGIDYLQTRTDIDANRIGCTGNSGGGNMTSFLMALDDRIQCAAPGNFITTTRIKNDRPGPGDAEQNLFSQTAIGLDHPDFILLRAPKPTLILAATQDFVPIEGTWTAYREAKRIYARLGFSERVDLVETDDKHGYNSELRVAMVRWMRRWLLGKNDVITEGDIKPFAEKELWCTPQGQVLLDKSFRSLPDLVRDEQEQLAQIRSATFEKLTTDKKRALIRNFSGVKPADEIVVPDVLQLETVLKPNYSVDRYVLDSELKMPVLVFVPAKPNGQFAIYLHESGKAAEIDGAVQKLLAAGTSVVTADLAGFGETEMKPWRYGSTSGVIGPNSAEVFVAYMLGESLVGVRGNQILQLTSFIRDKYKHAKPVELIAVGEPSVAALHVAALEPALFSKLVIRRGLHSWTSVCEHDVTKRQFENVIHGILRHYDLPDLVKMLGDRVQVEDPTNAVRELMVDS